MARHTHYVHHADCKVAEEYLASLHEDPMTAYSGCGDEIAEGWLRRHIRDGCDLCMEATVEANMP